MTLPTILQSQINVQPIDWGDMPRRFLNPGELEVLVALMRRQQPRLVVEFGVNVGRTAKAILANVASVRRYQGLDVPVGYVPAKAAQRGEVPDQPGELVRHDPRFELLVRPRGSADVTPDELLPCDAAFIDGDHSADGVRHDTLLTCSVMAPGGLIVWHDYHALGTVDVREVLDAMYARGAPIRHVTGTWIAFAHFKRTDPWHAWAAP